MICDKKTKLKIGSQQEVYWDSVLKQAEKSILNGKNEVVINETIVNLAKKKIKEEKEKFK